MADTLNDIFETLLVRIRALEARSRAPQSYYNLAVNGGFEVWSGGVGPFTVNGAINDAWTMAVGTGALSVAKDTTNQDTHYSRACAVCVCASLASGAVIKHRIQGPFTSSDDIVAISVRVRTNIPNAVRIKVGTDTSFYHSGSGRYETLVLSTVVTGGNFDVTVAFDAPCVAYIDNAMVVQGSAPIDYVTPTNDDGIVSILTYERVRTIRFQQNSDDIGTVAPGGSAIPTWPDVSGSDEVVGFHNDPMDSSAIIIEQPGRYAFEIDFNVVLQATGAPDTVPFLLELNNPLDITNMRWTIPLVNTGVDAPVGLVAMGMVPNPNTSLSFELISHATGYPITANNTVYGPGILLTIHYLGSLM